MIKYFGEPQPSVAVKSANITTDEGEKDAITGHIGHNVEVIHWSSPQFRI